MKFTIDEQYICDVIVKEQWSMFRNVPEDKLTPEELLVIMRGQDRVGQVYNMDHPEFTKLRDQLESLGYISTTRNCWNGDRVLKPFTLNDIKFKPGNSFPCAAALDTGIRAARAIGKKYKPSI